MASAHAAAELSGTTRRAGVSETGLPPSSVGVEPGQVAERLFRTAYDGVAKPIRFTQDATHMLEPENASFLYQARDGNFRFLGR
ncbi:hypothetical protein ACGFZQ_10820 [Streptomyces sp. NPDC048254]|uniref:hypothetical protein n=1 Tax=Streptomyces sp. NPDC048254 TaxID=3365525 RepID=UPI00371A5C1C